MPLGLPAASNHKIDYITQVKGILNLKENFNCIIGIKVTAIFLEGWILLNGGVASKGKQKRRV